MVLQVASSAPFLCAGSKDSLAFAADMAERGNWREARFRWEQLLADGALDAKVLNNLAVAAEAVGDGKSAGQHYARALELAGDEPAILDNFRRFERLSEIFGADDAAADGVEENSPSAAAPDPASAPAPASNPTEGGKIKGKAQRVSVVIPIPPRIDIEGLDTLLVASFLTDDSALLDINRELTRFLRGEFRQRTRLTVLDIVPPPAIPEQRIEDLIKNHEFWKHLGQEHEADLIVSGIVQFSRQEVSGFEEVDLISPTTGQKVRETRFVEQEEFNYGLDLLYMDGKTGALLFRDRLRRSVRFRGLMNDPLHAFYELSESLSDDIVAVVSTRMRVELRTIFKR
jgi:hypothetical protein